MRTQIYVPSVSAAGLLVIGHCIGSLFQQAVDVQWLALALLTLVTGSLTIKVPSVPARLSVSETFVFASVLLFGSCAGTITVALEILIAVAVVGATKKRADPQRVVFNVSSAALSIWIASNAFYLVAGIEPLSKQPAELDTLIIPLAVLSGTYFVLNSGLVAIALSLRRSESAVSIWKANFLGLAINYFAGASLAALFVSYTRNIDLWALSVFVPLLLISYLTFKTSLGRIEDATRHVDEIKRLYLSTIETLATAIDAKDQVTHGHIRRVQQLALALARELGVKDANQLQALEAAALLHDTGKLGIPEHILNKPGKLTRGEFEKMKSHAAIGAEILSSINFPYPVVPIVRHHHENWDGSGYPDGLKGIQIPVSARILAVVDCFDALTSDRPYRGRMSNADAVSVLLQRRGSMYDPLVVDTFVANLERLLQEITEDQESVSLAGTRQLQVIATEPLAVPFRRQQLAHFELLLRDVIRNVGATAGVIFAVDRERDSLVSLSAATAEGPISQPIAIPLGTGISGWVATSGIVIVNADASLDFRNSPPIIGLVRSICVPVHSGEQIVGVLSLYSDDPRGFNEDDKRALEQVALQLGDDAERHFAGMLRANTADGGVADTVH